MFVQDVKEETINFAIAAALKKQFPDWDVDPEYNRFGADQKAKLISVSQQRFLQYSRQGIVPNYDMTIEELYTHPERARVYPDIIVQQEKQEFNNLFIIKVKKGE